MPTAPLPPIEQIPAPRGVRERALAMTQRKITVLERQLGNLIKQRDAVLGVMNAQEGYKQRRLAEIISHGAVAGGGEPLTEHAVQRALRIVNGRMERSSARVD